MVKIKEIMEHKISQLKEEIKYYYHENKELKSNIEKIQIYYLTTMIKIFMMLDTI